MNRYCGSRTVSLASPQNSCTINDMKKCLYCWLFEPIPDTFEDSSDFIPTFSIPFRSARGESVFSLFVSSDGRPQYMRMEIAGLEQEAIPDEMAPMLQAAKEHLLSVLRMTYSAHIQLSPYALWYFVEEGEKYEWGVDLIKQYGELTFDVDRTRRVFMGTFSHREEIRLFVDGFD